jgi:hypothetical protein
MESEIKHLCHVLIDTINARDFEYQGPEARIFRTQHISPDFQAKLDSTPWSMSYDEQNDMWRQAAIDFPTVHFELRAVDCTVHKNDRTANVILHTTMLRGQMKMLTACQMKWKFSKGRWQWYHHSGIRGITCEG